MIEILDDIRLESLVSTDASAIFNTIDSQREYLGKWLPFISLTTSVEVTQSFVDSVVNTPLKNNEPTFAIRKSGEFIGLIGFKLSDNINRKTEIGYWLSEPFQGQGVMTSAVKKICEYAFSDLNMNRVQIKCAVGNSQSRAIPNRLGFIFEGIERAGELCSNETFYDIEVYSLLKLDFAQQ